MKLDAKMLLIYVGGSAIIIVGGCLTAIGIYSFYTEGRNLLNYVLHEGVELMSISTELRHLLIACVLIAIGLLIGYIGIFIVKGQRSCLSDDF